MDHPEDQWRDFFGRHGLLRVSTKIEFFTAMLDDTEGIYIQRIFGYLRDAHTYSQIRRDCFWVIILDFFFLGWHASWHTAVSKDCWGSSVTQAFEWFPKKRIPPTSQVGLIVPIPSSQYRTVGSISFLGHAWILRERHDIYEYFHIFSRKKYLKHCSPQEVFWRSGGWNPAIFSQASTLRNEWIRCSKIIRHIPRGGKLHWE